MGVSLYQGSFAGGEWAPSLYGRISMAKYPTAARKVRNFIVEPHGPVSNRPGTEYVCEVKDSTRATRMVPFQFNVEQSYTLEVGHEYIRIIKDAGQVVLSSTPAAYAAGTTYAQGDHVADGGINYYSLQDGNLGNTPAASASYWHALTDDIVEFPTSYQESELFQLRFTQSADTLFITHKNHPPRQLTRTAHDEWKIIDIAFGSSTDAPTGVASGGSGYSLKVTAVKLGVESAASAAVAGGSGGSMTWTAVSGAEYYRVYRSVNGIYGWLADVSASPYTVESADPDLQETAPESQTVFSGVGEYPAVCTIHQQRLLFGRPSNKPQTINGSRTGDFPNFNRSTPLRDDDAYEFTLDSGQVNEIRALVAMDDLIILTSGNEFKMKSGSSSDSITPTSVDNKRQGRRGAAAIEPLVIGKSVLFIQYGQAAIRDLSYSLDVDGYTGNDLSVLAEHLFRSYSVAEWTYQRSPHSVVWCVRNDGKLLGLTYMKEHEVWGWHQHDTDGYFESVASITDGDDSDEVYFVVRRIVGGVTKRYVEKLGKRFVNDEERPDMAYFVDCGLTYDNPLTITDIAVDGGTGQVTVTSAAHGLSDGDKVRISRIEGYTLIEDDNEIDTSYDLNDNWYLVSDATADTFELKDEFGSGYVDGADFATYAQGGEARKGVSSISGLGHLNGKTVAVLADGNVQDAITVSAGSITLDRAAATVHVGLSYTSELETMDLVFNTEGGTVQDKLREVVSVVVSMQNSRNLEIGPGDKGRDGLDEIEMRTDEDYDDAIELFTGDKTQYLTSGEGSSARLLMRNKVPVPCTIIAVTPYVETGD